MAATTTPPCLLAAPSVPRVSDPPPSPRIPAPPAAAVARLRHVTTHELADAVDAFTHEQRITNAILREIASSLRLGGASARGSAGTRPISPVGLAAGSGQWLPLPPREEKLQDGSSDAFGPKSLGPKFGSKRLDSSAASEEPRAKLNEVILPVTPTGQEEPRLPDISESECSADYGSRARIFSNLQGIFGTSERSHSRSKPTKHNLQRGLSLLSKKLSGDLPKLKTWSSLFNMFYFTEGAGRGKQVIFYNFDRMQEWAAIPCILCCASIFRLRKSLGLQIVAQLCIIVSITFSIQLQCLSEERLQRIGNDADAIGEIASKLNSLCPFLLGLFVALCLRRWWQMRTTHLQKLFSATAQLSFWLRASLPKRASWIRERIEKDCLLGHRLLYIGAQTASMKETGSSESLGATNSTLDTLMADGLLTSDDVTRLELRIGHIPKRAEGIDGLFDFSLATLPFTWSAHLIYRVFQFGVRTKGERGVNIPTPVCVKMLGLCMTARQAIEGVEVMLASPLPFPYVHLVCLLVHFSALFSCVRLGLNLGCEPALTVELMFFETVCVLTVNSLYLGLLCLSAIVADPFGGDTVDFPAALLQHKLWKAQYFAASILEDDDSIDSEITEKLGESTETHTLFRGGGPGEPSPEEEDEEDDDDGH